MVWAQGGAAETSVWANRCSRVNASWGGPENLDAALEGDVGGVHVDVSDDGVVVAAWMIDDGLIRNVAAARLDE